MDRVLSTLLVIFFFIAVITIITLLPADNHLPVVTITPTAMPTPTSSPTPRPSISPTLSPSQPVTYVQWGGYTWEVTDYKGGVFTSRNVWVDQDGKLHMKLIYENGTWHSFNVKLTDPVGQGTFKWRINSNIDYIQDTKDGGNPYFWFGLFLYDNSIPEYSYGDIDVAFCKWGKQDSTTNTDWTIWSDNHHVESRHIAGSNNDYTLEWMPDHIKYTVNGPEQPQMEYTFTDSSKIPPVTGQMRFIIWIGQRQDAAPPNNLSYYEAEVVLSNFQVIQNPQTPRPVKYIQWGGYTWEVTDYKGGVFTSRNVWVDQDGKLHMKSIYENGAWHNFNVILTQYVGYGTFKWRIDNNIDYIQDVKDGGNPYFWFGPFLYDSSIPQYNHGETDIEHCKWGKTDLESNTDWTTYTDGKHVEYRHIVGAKNNYTLEWMPDHIRFAVEGPEQPLMEYTTDSAKSPPVSGKMQFIILIGQRQDMPPPNNLNYYEAEVVLSNFEIIPNSP